jgi:hypothetical protein
MGTYRRLRVRLNKGDREKLDDILSGGVLDQDPPSSGIPAIVPIVLRH